MKKLLFSFAVFMMGTAILFAQFPGIGLIGDATSAGWDGPDIDMVTTDGVTYTYEGLTLTAGTVKFRQDDGWTNNWGGATWPSGTGLFNSGNNIPSQPGLYNVTFNLTTLEYSFEDAGNFPDLVVVSGGQSSTMFTIDGVNYTANNVSFETETEVQFELDGETMWGGNDFPSGTAVEGGSVTVPANSYNITYSLETNAYMFNYVVISLTGTGVEDWGIDANFTTTDGVNYTLSAYTFLEGEVKFRLNNDWGVTWGNATFPSGTAEVVGDGGNIAIPAGVYDVAFNRMTGEFAFTAPTAGNEEFSKNTVAVYPNPAQNVWNFTSAGVIDSIMVYDISGKVMFTAQFGSDEASVDAAGFASGIYFAQIASGKSVQTVKVIKK